VGPGIAKRLGLTQLTYVSRIRELDKESGRIVVERRAEGGIQVLSSRAPALITMLDGGVELRRGTMADALRAARAEVVRWSAADAGISDLGKCGLRGSPTIVKSVFAPSPRADKAKQMAVDNAALHEVAEALIDEIFARQKGLAADLCAS
jgi:electron transfer flavoprotein beta subunit